MDMLSELWPLREGPAVFTTVDQDGNPNSVYVGEIQYVEATGFVIADNYFAKTRANIHAGSRGSILFLTRDHKAYQAKGVIGYHPGGPMYELMLQAHDVKHPGVAAVVVRVDELYCGAEKLF